MVHLLTNFVSRERYEWTNARSRGFENSLATNRWNPFETAIWNTVFRDSALAMPKWVSRREKLRNGTHRRAAGAGGGGGDEGAWRAGGGSDATPRKYGRLCKVYQKYRWMSDKHLACSTISSGDSRHGNDYSAQSCESNEIDRGGQNPPSKQSILRTEQNRNVWHFEAVWPGFGRTSIRFGERTPLEIWTRPR